MAEQHRKRIRPSATPTGVQKHRKKSRPNCPESPKNPPAAGFPHGASVWQSDAVPAWQGQPLDDGAGLGVPDGEPHDDAVAEPGEQAVHGDPGGERVPHGDGRRPAALLEAARGAGEAARLGLGEDGPDVVLR